jgi:hypothetical protein
LKKLDVKKCRDGKPRNMAPPGQKPSKTAGDMNKRELNDLFNSKVEKVIPVERRMPGYPGLKHKANLVKVEDGKYYLIEKGKSYAVNGRYKLIISDANNMAKS